MDEVKIKAPSQQPTSIDSHANIMQVLACFQSDNGALSGRLNLLRRRLDETQNTLRWLRHPIHSCWLVPQPIHNRPHPYHLPLDKLRAVHRHEGFAHSRAENPD